MGNDRRFTDWKRWYGYLGNGDNTEKPRRSDDDDAIKDYDSELDVDAHTCDRDCNHFDDDPRMIPYLSHPEDRADSRRIRARRKHRVGCEHDYVFFDEYRMNIMGSKPKMLWFRMRCTKCSRMKYRFS